MSGGNKEIFIILSLGLISGIRGDFGGNRKYEEISKYINDVESATDHVSRPNYGGPALNVNISLDIQRISISEINETTTADLTLFEKWIDDRLPVSPQNVSVSSVDFKIWQPDTIFPDGRVLRSYGNPKTSIQVYPQGLIAKKTRLSLISRCKMDFSLLPLDSHECTISVQSLWHGTDNVRYIIDEDIAWNLRLFDSSEFKLLDVSKGKKTSIDINGSHDVLYMSVKFSRSPVFYVFSVYLPIMLMVIASWFTFVVDSDFSMTTLSVGPLILSYYFGYYSMRQKDFYQSSFRAIDAFIYASMIFITMTTIEIVLKRKEKKRPLLDDDLKKTFRVRSYGIFIPIAYVVFIVIYSIFLLSK